MTDRNPGNWNTPGKAYVIDTSTTSVNQTLSATCRRIRIKAHTQDCFYALGTAAQVAEGEPAAVAATATAAAESTAEVDTVTLSGFYEVRDSVAVTVDGTTVTYEVVDADVSNTSATTLTNVAAKVRDAINANATISANITATASSGVVTLTHGTVNVAFTTSVAVTEADDDNHFLDKLSADGLVIDVPAGSSVAVKTLSGSGKVYISELNW